MISMPDVSFLPAEKERLIGPLPRPFLAPADSNGGGDCAECPEKHLFTGEKLILHRGKANLSGTSLPPCVPYPVRQLLRTVRLLLARHSEYARVYRENEFLTQTAVPKLHARLQQLTESSAQFQERAQAELLGWWERNSELQAELAAALDDVEKLEDQLDQLHLELEMKQTEAEATTCVAQLRGDTLKWQEERIRHLEKLRCPLKTAVAAAGGWDHDSPGREGASLNEARMLRNFGSNIFICSGGGPPAACTKIKHSCSSSLISHRQCDGSAFARLQKSEEDFLRWLPLRDAWNSYVRREQQKREEYKAKMRKTESKQKKRWLRCLREAEMQGQRKLRAAIENAEQAEKAAEKVRTEYEDMLQRVLKGLETENDLRDYERKCLTETTLPGLEEKVARLEQEKAVLELKLGALQRKVELELGDLGVSGEVLGNADGCGERACPFAFPLSLTSGVRLVKERQPVFRDADDEEGVEKLCRASTCNNPFFQLNSAVALVCGEDVDEMKNKGNYINAAPKNVERVEFERLDYYAHEDSIEGIQRGTGSKLCSGALWQDVLDSKILFEYYEDEVLVGLNADILRFKEKFQQMRVEMEDKDREIGRLKKTVDSLEEDFEAQQKHFMLAGVAYHGAYYGDDGVEEVDKVRDVQTQTEGVGDNDEDGGAALQKARAMFHQRSGRSRSTHGHDQRVEVKHGQEKGHLLTLTKSDVRKMKREARKESRLRMRKKLDVFSVHATLYPTDYEKHRNNLSKYLRLGLFGFNERASDFPQIKPIRLGDI